MPEYEPRRGARFLTFVFLRVRLVMQRSLKAAKRDRAHAEATEGSCSNPESREERLGIEQERALRQRAIEQALLQLDKTASALVHACFWEDQSLAEAARRLGLGYDDARYRLRRALRVIGKMLSTPAQLGSRPSAPTGRQSKPVPNKKSACRETFAFGLRATDRTRVTDCIKISAA